MELMYLLEEYRRRVPWFSAKSIFNQFEIEKGQGWDNTILKLMHKARDNVKYDAQLKELLPESLVEFTYCGEKLIQFYKIDESTANTLCSQLLQFEIPDSEFKTHFPFQIPGSALSNNIDNPKIVRVTESGGLTKIIICCVREYEEIVSLSSADLKDDVVANYDLPEQSEVFIRHKECRQFYDVITVDPIKGILQLRLDWGLGMKRHDAKRAILQTLRFIKEVAQSLGVELDIGAGPLNLFPLVQDLYNKPQVGRVCELGFTVNSGSVKSEKLRRHNTDIRDEDFHRGGREAVDGQLSAYRLSLTWTFRERANDEANPELTLPGTIANLNDPMGKPLNEAILTKCFKEEDFINISYTLLDHLLNE